MVGEGILGIGRQLLGGRLAYLGNGAAPSGGRARRGGMGDVPVRARRTEDSGLGSEHGEIGEIEEENRKGEWVEARKARLGEARGGQLKGKAEPHRGHDLAGNLAGARDVYSLPRFEIANAIRAASCMCRGGGKFGGSSRPELAGR